MREFYDYMSKQKHKGQNIFGDELKYIQESSPIRNEEKAIILRELVKEIEGDDEQRGNIFNMAMELINGAENSVLQESLKNILTLEQYTANKTQQRMYVEDYVTQYINQKRTEAPTSEEYSKYDLNVSVEAPQFSIAN